MLFIRSLIFSAGQITSAIVYSLIAILCYPLPPLTRSRVIGYWAHAMMWWLRATCGLSYQVKGLENLPDTPCVILSKHQSAWETIAFQTIFPPQAWVLKRELLWIPFFGWGLAATRPIAINRSQGARALESVVKQGIARIEEGRWVVVFPEGTRTAPGEHGRYNPGGAMLASKAQVPVVPVAHNAGEFWPRRGFIKKPGTIVVSIGPIIETTGRRAKQINAEAETWIENEMSRLRILA